MIDWFTVSAQIINFLILVFLLKRFLYGPIISAMDRREEKIASRLEEAEERKADARNRIEEYHRKNEELESRRSEMMEQAKREAEEQKKKMIDDARSDIEQIRRKWTESVNTEKETFLREIRKRIGEEVHIIARRALADLAEADLERHMIKVFVTRLGELGEEDRRNITESLRQDGSLTVASSFEIAEDDRKSVAGAIEDITGGSAGIRYEQSGDILCGIELRTGDYRIGWNVDEYVKSLGEEFSKSLEKGIGGGT